MASLTVMVLYGAESILLMHGSIRTSSIVTLRLMARLEKQCWGSGYEGSFSPGAAARMMALQPVSHRVIHEGTIEEHSPGTAVKARLDQ